MFDNKKVIIFDMDGTLIDSIGVWNKVDKETIKYYTGLLIDEKEAKDKRDKVLSSTKEPDIYLAYAKYLKEEYNINETAENIRKKREEMGLNLIRKEVTFKNGAKELLRTLKNKGYLLAVATTTTKECIDIYDKLNDNTKEIDFYNTFDLILTKESVTKKKPNPEIHLKILKHFNVSPDECLVFEDTLYGVEAAKRADIDVVAVYDENSKDKKTEIMKLADYYIYNFKEILNSVL